MQKPKIDDKLTLLTDFGETEAICTEVLDDPATAEGVLLKVMVRGPSLPKQSIAKSRFQLCSPLKDDASLSKRMAPARFISSSA